jgi:hypothetical protein
MLCNHANQTNNGTDFIWVVGSPRSGTTFLTSFIGKNVDKEYNEPWGTHPLNKEEIWKFPNVDKIVFKYCANIFRYETITNRFPNSKWIHIIRSPDHVIYSMCFPKKDAIPIRNFPEYGNETLHRFKTGVKIWHRTMLESYKIKDLIQVEYESMDANKLSQAINVPMSQEKWDRQFHCRNEDVDKMLPMWDKVDPKYKRLRNKIVRRHPEC